MRACFETAESKGRKWRKIRDEDFPEHTVAQVRNRYLRMETGKTTVAAGTFHYHCRRCGMPRQPGQGEGTTWLVFKTSPWLDTRLERYVRVLFYFF